MIVITNIFEMHKKMNDLRLQGKTIGFVPTMGYLHEGHVSLLNEARQQNDVVVLSIFVNPLQFGPNEDYERYPRDIERDEQIAKQAGVDVLFYPDVKEMYPKPLSIKTVVTKRVHVLCGKSRPGHFDGVAAVLMKLFNIVMPHRAYFGMKDAQQVAVVDGLIRDFNFPINLVPVPTVREEDGLAKSSRNIYLSEKERQEAPALYRSLQLAKEAIQEGERNPLVIKQIVTDYIIANTSAKIDYVDLYTYPELEEIEEIAGKIIIAIAVRFTNARLIDNITFDV